MTEALRSRSHDAAEQVIRDWFDSDERIEGVTHGLPVPVLTELVVRRAWTLHREPGDQERHGAYHGFVQGLSHMVVAADPDMGDRVIDMVAIQLDSWAVARFHDIRRRAEGGE